MVRYEDDLAEALKTLCQNLFEKSDGKERASSAAATDFASAAAGFSVLIAQEKANGEGSARDGAKLLYKLLNLMAESGVSFDRLAAELIALQREAGQADNPLRARDGNFTDMAPVKLPPKLR